ncbi:MAG: DMT family transporter [Mariniblastus sp.]|nr:DMT family transporter [Mariniblastus sp.]
MGIGEWSALLAALLWTLSSMIWGRIRLSAITINLAKNIIGVVLILAHLALFASFTDREMFQAPWSSWGTLGLSGLIGIVIGDTMYFRSLQILGPRRALMMATTSPLFAAALAFAFLGEELPFFAVLGICLAVCGVIVVVADRKANKEAPGLLPGSLRRGVALGIIGSICQAIGGVFSKKGLVGAEGENLCDPIEATFIRLLFAALATMLVMSVGRKLVKELRITFSWEMLRLLIPATAVGTWLGIWLSQVGYQRAHNVAIAQTLMSTCPLFAIPIVWVLHKHRVTALSVIGTIVAVLGIFLTVYEG